ncbi:MAG: VOC family protein [Promicromonosporaceae bacterium]|nr:VOC family protein [Promicromonosporaceae bacterium]
MSIFQHIGMQGSDLPASGKFYDAVLEPLGIERKYADDDMVVYGNWDFWVEKQSDGDGFRQSHIAFVAPNKQAVDAFQAAAEAQGAEVLHSAKEWPEYVENPETDTYYAAFVRDPDGNNIEAAYVTG